MLGKNWICILKFVLWFDSVILNFNAFYNAYTVQRLYTALLRSKRIFCLVLGIMFGIYFLTVSNEIEDFMALFNLLL